ncbi:MAG: Lrp/AsnC family transcriptional regulator [Pusillimonas sp.]
MTTPPTSATRLPVSSTPSRTPAPAPQLDDLDRRILEHLQRDASLTNQDLARKVHASAPTCLRRVRRLIQTGIIEKQVAILNPRRLSNSLTAICEITLDVQTAESLTAFEDQVVQDDAIVQCYRVSPGPDFIVIANIPDMPAYHALAHRVFTSQRNVRNVRSFFSTHRAKFDTRMQLPLPAEPRR